MRSSSVTPLTPVRSSGDHLNKSKTRRKSVDGSARSSRNGSAQALHKRESSETIEPSRRESRRGSIGNNIQRRGSLTPSQLVTQVTSNVGDKKKKSKMTN